MANPLQDAQSSVYNAMQAYLGKAKYDPAYDLNKDGKVLYDDVAALNKQYIGMLDKQVEATNAILKAGEGNRNFFTVTRKDISDNLDLTPQQLANNTVVNYWSQQSEPYSRVMNAINNDPSKLKFGTDEEGNTTISTGEHPGWDTLTLKPTGQPNVYSFSTYNQVAAGNISGVLVANPETGFVAPVLNAATQFAYTPGSPGGVIRNIVSGITSGVNSLGPLGAVALAYATSGLSAEIGAALGLEGAAATLVGNTLLQTTLNGGDVGKALTNSLVSYAGASAGGLAAQFASDGELGSFLKDNPQYATTIANTAARAALTGQSLEEAVKAATVTVGTDAALAKIDGFKDLPSSVQNTIKTAVSQELQGKDVNLPNLLTNSAINGLTSYALNQNEDFKKLDPKLQSLISTELTAGLQGKPLDQAAIKWAMNQGTQSITKAAQFPNADTYSKYGGDITAYNSEQAAIKAEQERLAQVERDRVAAQQEAERQAQLAKDAADKEEREKAEFLEQQAREEAAKHQAELDRIAAEQAKKAEEDRKAEEARKAEEEKKAAEKAEADRQAAKKAEEDRIAAEKAEEARKAAEAEAERQAQLAKYAADEEERKKAEFLEQQAREEAAKRQAEIDKLAAEKAEADRVAAEKAEADRVAAEKAEADRVAAQKAEADKVAAEKAEEARKAAEAEAARQAQLAKDAADEEERKKAEFLEQQAREEAAKHQAELDRIAAEKTEADRLAALKAEEDKKAAEKEEADRKAAEKAEADRLAAEAAKTKETTPETKTEETVTVISHDPDTNTAVVVDSKGEVKAISSDPVEVGTVITLPGTDTSEGGEGQDSIPGGTETKTEDTAKTIVDEDGNTITIHPDGTVTTTNATVDGGEGTDTLQGGSGTDTLNGSQGQDTLLGGNGEDTLKGGEGEDTSKGGEGQDTQEGGDGGDSVEGGEATTQGGTGTDTMDGGEGTDTTCATGFHWDEDLQMCVADDDEAKTDTSCPDGYIYDFTLRQCVPIDTSDTKGTSSGDGGKSTGTSTVKTTDTTKTATEPKKTEPVPAVKTETSPGMGLGALLSLLSGDSTPKQNTTPPPVADIKYYYDWGDPFNPTRGAKEKPEKPEMFDFFDGGEVNSFSVDDLIEMLKKD